MSSVLLDQGRLPVPDVIARRRRLPARTRVAVVVARLAGAASRRMLLGRGAVIGGRVALAIDPLALSRLTAGRAVTLVSGTNGKTTTTLLIAEALASTRTVSSTSGANLTTGHVSAASATSDELVLEVDELYLPRTMEATRPTVLALLNLSRDQLDRMVELRRIAELWKSAIEGVTWTMTIVANADDPLLVWAVGRFVNVVWVSGGAPVLQDSTLCPACGRAADIARCRAWWCVCGAGRPTPDWVTDSDCVHGPQFTSSLHPALPGAVNRSNAAVAIAVATARKIEPNAALTAVEQVSAVAGRYRTVRIGTCVARLLLAKNPASWTEVLELIADGDGPVVICVNAQGPDGHDTSWLWDVPFERLAGRPVAATGERRWDLAMRLQTAGVACRVVTDPIDAVIAIGSPDVRVELISTYSAFQRVLRRLHVRW